MAAPDVGVAFVKVLQSAGLPESLWDVLLHKVETGDLGVGGHLQASRESRSSTVIACHALDASSHVFLLEQALRGTRATILEQLASDPGFLDECRQLLQLPAGAGERALDEVYRELWAWARPSPREGASGGQTEWHLDAREALWARHDENPAAKVVALPLSVAAALRGADTSEAPGLSMMWLMRDVPAGAEVTRDQLPGKRSLQRAAALVALLGLPPRRWAVEGQYLGLKAAVDEAMQRQLPPGVGQPPPSQVPGDRRPLEQGGATKEVLTVWTDYPLVREHLEAHSGPFVVTGDRAAADIVFTPQPVRDFHSLPSHVLMNQFPYEACLVRKDLLPQTLRRWQSAAADEGASESGSHECFPPWFPAAYDLATEVHFFLKDYQQRAAERRDNFWVVKLAQGARSADVFVSDSVEAILCHRAALGDRIAQACVRQPVLYQGRKIDLRLYLAVRSFEKREAFLFRSWYGRVANKQYTLDPAQDHDYHTHFTVSCYDPDEAMRSQQLMVPHGALVAELKSQGLDVADIEIGAWPRSRAVYGLDVLLERGAGTCSAKLLEVNFCPDFTTLARMEACFISDTFACLFTSAPAPASFWLLAESTRPASALDGID